MPDAPEFWTRTRFIVMVLLLFCLSSIWSNILAFNFALICIRPNDSLPLTAPENVDRFKLKNESYLTSTVAAAALLANFPIVHAVNKQGIRSVFTVLGLISGAATLAIPAAVRETPTNYVFLYACRFLQGLGFAAIFPVVGAFSAKWTYYKQTGLFVSVLVSYVQLSPVITSPVAGTLCGTNGDGWPSVFYVHGSVSIALFATYAALYRNSPSKHPFVGERECRKLSIGKSSIDKMMLRRIPYRTILTTPAIWAVWLGAIGNFAAVNLMLLFNPKYFSDVLELGTAATGLLAAVPPLAQFIVKLACGAASDRITSISEQTKYRLFNSIAFLGSATCFGALAWIDNATNVPLNLFLLLGAAGILGAVTGGFYKAGPALSKQYSHFVTGNISVVLTVTMMAVPLLVERMTSSAEATRATRATRQTNPHDEWRGVFAVVAGLLVLSNVIFCAFVKGEPCEWTKDEWIKRNSINAGVRHSHALSRPRAPAAVHDRRVYEPDRHEFSDTEDTMITVAVAAAALITNIPIVFVVNRDGIRSIFTGLGLLSGAATIAIPAAVRGVAFAAVFPAVGTFAAKWTYYKQTGLFVSVLVAYVQFAPVITSPISGVLCDHADWPSVFYFHGGVTLVLFSAYAFFYRNTPKKHPFVGAVESNKIDIGKSHVDKTTLRRIPYRAIFATPAIWAIWLGAVGNFATVELMFLYNPVYMKKVLKMSTSAIGTAAAIPPLVQFLVKLVCGAASDRIKFVSELVKYRFFNSLAFLGCAACFTALAFIDADRPIVNLALLVVGASVLGCSTGGFYKAAPALSKQYSHFVTGFFSIVISATMVVIPFVVDGVAPHATPDQWRRVFGIIAAVLLVTNTIFCALIRGEPCVWTTDEWIQEHFVKGVNKPARY
ncbi:hypothetical protein PRIPAC_88274 [Pristionchus pacificus]|uniref:Membrane transporter n=1 Tax=Pristionchus pacificus TaxID=54126 RepID=A0A2A6CWF6_PRIPA|nr:hypothetical protein PRIPAC_88274 [Pristionchus pacificus]|eukprot:PDM82525.1 membrane transporter [Pristionchus pacificus]